MIRMHQTRQEPLDFSGESFERFQALLRGHCHPESWLWILRDGIFSTITHDPLTLKRVIRTKDALLLLPGGWVVWLLLHKIFALLGKISPLPQPSGSTHHLLFLSARSNHIKRVLPLLRDFSEHASCTGWANQEKILSLIDENLKSQMRLAENSWGRTIRVSDLWTAASCGNELNRLIPRAMTPWLQRGKVRIYVAIFLAWRRFWNEQFQIRPEFVLTTYEKDPMAKAMLHVALEAGVPTRIHWAHGLRHASLQSTLATELWCLIEPDVNYYRALLPKNCEPIYKQSPEALELIRDIGILDENDLRGLECIHFLFLGNGFDASYTSDLSRADFKVIQTAMAGLGSQVRWRFRPHPGNIPSFRQDLAALGMEDVEVSTNPLRDDLQWAHAAGSPFSSVLVDMKQTGRKIFWVQEKIRPLYGVDELIREGYGIHIDSMTAVSRIREAFGIGNELPPSDMIALKPEQEIETP